MQLFDALSLIQNVLEACGTRLPWESMTPGQSQWLLSGWGGVTSGRKRGGERGETGVRLRRAPPTGSRGKKGRRHRQHDGPRRPARRGHSSEGRAPPRGFN